MEPNQTTETTNTADMLGEFIAAHCDLQPGAESSAGDLYERYVGWCEATTTAVVSQRAFGLALSEREFDKRSSNGRVLYAGIALRPVSGDGYEPRGWDADVLAQGDSGLRAPPNVAKPPTAIEPHVTTGDLVETPAPRTDEKQLHRELRAAKQLVVATSEALSDRQARHRGIVDAIANANTAVQRIEARWTEIAAYRVPSMSEHYKPAPQAGAKDSPRAKSMYAEMASAKQLEVAAAAQFSDAHAAASDARTACDRIVAEIEHAQRARCHRQFTAVERATEAHSSRVADLATATQDLASASAMCGSAEAQYFVEETRATWQALVAARNEEAMHTQRVTNATRRLSNAESAIAAARADYAQAIASVDVTDRAYAATDHRAADHALSMITRVNPQESAAHAKACGCASYARQLADMLLSGVAT